MICTANLDKIQLFFKNFRIIKIRKFKFSQTAPAVYTNSESPNPKHNLTFKPIRVQ